MDPKWILGSKVFWFNVLALVVGIAQAFGFAGFTPDPKTAEYVMVMVTLINLILRFATRQPVSLSRPKTISFVDTKPRAH